MKKKNRIWIYAFIALGLTLFFNNGCQKNDNDSNGDKIGAAKDLLSLSPEYQPGTYRNMDKIFSTRTFKRGQSVYALPCSAQPLTSVTYSPDGVKTYGIDDFIERNNVAGLLIIKDGQIALERYAEGNTETSRWTSFSVGKSIVSTLIGIAVKEGKIDIHNLVTYYLPQLQGTAYDGVTVRQLLQMSSGVQWNEEYLGGATSFADMWQCLLAGKGGILEVMSKLPRAAEPGTKFNYNTGETFVEGQVLKAALGGESLSSYLSRKIWANMGMESDGYWLLDSKDGSEFAGGNLSMTLRDYGRFGMFMLNNGVVNGTSMLPANWIAEATVPADDSPQCGYGKLYAPDNCSDHPYSYPPGYGYNWWALPTQNWGIWEHLNDPLWWGADTLNVVTPDLPNLSGSFVAQGVFGQFIIVNQKENLVAVVWSTWKDTWIDPKEYEVYSFLNAAATYLKK